VRSLSAVLYLSMCSQFTLRADLKKLINNPIEVSRLDLGSGARVDLRVLPGAQAPIVLLSQGRVTLQSMRFGLIPAWSEEPKLKFATHNARLKSRDQRTGRTIAVFEKPTWKSAFRLRHCVVPMSEFIEPIYTGALQGSMVAFSSSDDELLWAAGIWEQWRSPKTGECIDSFAILTDEPIPFVRQVGHDRSPVLLREAQTKDWLKSEGGNPELILQEILELRSTPALRTSVDRKLAQGWEKRAKKV
jgi:putative SOS response-associated peptidase YedK